MPRPIIRWPLGLLACALLVACTPPGAITTAPGGTLTPTAPPLISDGRSGVQGLTLRGPVCPGPARLDQPSCDDAPFQAELKVMSEDGAVLARFSSDQAGRFRLALPPGRYRLASDLPGLLPRLAPVLVEVPAQTFVLVELNFDTGMR